MSVAHELRLFRIQTLQRAYRAHQSDLPLLEERIGLLRDILAHYHLPGELDPNPVFLAKLHYDIGYSLYERHMHLKDIGDLEHAESHLRLALADLASGVLFPGPHSVLGSVLRECAYILEDSDRAKEAVLVHRPLLPNNGVVPPLEQAYHARELGRSLHTSSLLSNHDRGCLFESIACLKRSQALYSEAGVTDHMCAFGLSFASSSLYAARTNKSHLDHAISYGELALEVCGPHHRDVFAVKSRLEYLRLTRIEYFSPDDQVLDRVIDTLREALVDAPSGWVVLLTHSLAYGFGIRCSRQGHKDDLSEAIAYTREAMFSLAANDPSQCRLQSCLSGLLFTRFKITGIPQDIEAAACAANMAVSNAVARTGNYFAWLNNLAACRATQYTAFGDLATLDECITLLEQIMQSAPLHGSGWKLAASNMLEALQHRYQATRTTADLDRAMQMVHLVLEYKDEKAWMSPMDLHNAGIVFLSRFEVTNASEDLDRATALLREAAEDHTIDTHMSHEWKGTYARVLRLRAEALHDEPCATEALEIQQQIVTSLPDVHPDRAQALCGLARLQLSANSSADTVADSLTALLHALNNHQCPAYRRLKDVSDVLSYLANHPVEHDHATQVSMVYSTAIALLPEVASFGLNPSARLAVMSGAGSLTTQGAIHSISIGQLDVALEMLEAGRNVFWTQNLQLRTSFMHLPKTVADKLTKIAYALARPMPDGLDVPRRDRELAQRRQAGDDFRSVLNETRLIPGFEGLLRNASFASIVQAAARHPIVVFVADETSGHAIIIQSEVDCRLVKLLHATTTSLQKLSGCLGGHITHARSSRGMRKIEVETHLPVNVYQEVWTLVMRPVVEALQWPVSRFIHALTVAAEIICRSRRGKSDDV
jgi:tetratricopeptide (TPR) repeat protein